MVSTRILVILSLLVTFAWCHGRSDKCDLRIDTTTNVPISQWGPNDNLGALNRLGPHKVRDAVNTITEGKTYQLGNVLSSSTPGFGTRLFRSYVYPVTIDNTANNGFFFDDIINPGYIGVGSQLDWLAHFCIGYECYNQNRAQNIFRPTDEANNVLGVEDGTPIALDGVSRLGVDHMQPIVTRGVLLNMPPIFNKPRLGPGDEISCKHIVEALRRQRLEIKEGDIVLIHTGWSYYLNDTATFVGDQPGITLSAAQFLINKKVTAIGADNIALEAVPSAENQRIWPGSSFPVHSLLIAKNGIPIMEVINTEILVRNGVDNFMFVLSPIRVKGAAQSYVNPVAIK